SHHPTPPTTTYTLSLHDALPIYLTKAASTETSCSCTRRRPECMSIAFCPTWLLRRWTLRPVQATDTSSGQVHQRCTAQKENGNRSEEHTSELQSPYDLVCRLLLE